MYIYLICTIIINNFDLEFTASLQEVGWAEQYPEPGDEKGTSGNE